MPTSPNDTLDARLTPDLDRLVAPTRRGLGRSLVQQAVAHELGSEARLALPPEGAAYELRVPIARLTAAL